MPSFVSGRTTFSLPAVNVVNRSIILVLLPAIKWYSVLSCKISVPVVSTQLSVETKEQLFNHTDFNSSSGRFFALLALAGIHDFFRR